MVLGPGIWHEEIKISGFSEVMMIYSDEMMF